MTNDNGPTLTDQVTRLYDLIGGSRDAADGDRATTRALGVLTAEPGLNSDAIAKRLETDAFYMDVLCRTAFAFGLIDRQGDGWKMAPHFDQFLGNPESSFFLAGASRIHMSVGEDYKDYVRHFRDGTTKPYQEHDNEFMEDIAAGLKTLPRIFLDYVLPNLPASGRGSRLGRASSTSVAAVVGVGPVRRALRRLAVRWVRHGAVFGRPGTQADRGARLQERCEVRLAGIEALGEEGAYDIATSFLVVTKSTRR